MNPVYERIERRQPADIADLAALCQLPSVSTQRQSLEQTAALCARIMESRGLDARIIPIPEGPPVVFAERRGRSSATLLLYDHYDVQPPDPLDEWESPPFDLTERAGRLYGRGTADNKGTLMSRLAAVSAWLDATGELPVSVKFMVEGEEEVGSPHVDAFVQSNRSLLAADGCLWESGGVNWQGRPVITSGLKGILYVELEARGANHDIHSAQATTIVNPAWRLVWALGSLKDEREQVRIDGFYQAVRAASSQDLAAVARMPSDEEQTKISLGIRHYLLGLTGLELRARNLFAPTCTICGLWSGCTGEGSKTVLPAVAHAKVDFRLVPDMDPSDILRKLRRHLDKHGFTDIAIRTADAGARAWRTPIDDPFVRLVSAAAYEVYATEPVMSPTMGGSGPMYPFGAYLGLPMASSGAANPDSRVHAPNENITVPDFLLAAKHTAAIMGKMGGS